MDADRMCVRERGNECVAPIQQKPININVVDVASAMAAAIAPIHRILYLYIGIKFKSKYLEVGAGRLVSRHYAVNAHGSNTLVLCFKCVVCYLET